MSNQTPPSGIQFQLNVLQTELQTAMAQSYQRWLSKDLEVQRRYLETLATHINPVWYQEKAEEAEKSGFLGIRDHFPHPAYHFGATQLALTGFLNVVRQWEVVLDSLVPFYDNYTASIECEEGSAEEARRFFFPASWQENQLMITVDFYHQHGAFVFTRTPVVTVLKK